MRYIFKVKILKILEMFEMKKIVFLFFGIIFLMVSCKPKYVEVVQTLHADGSRRAVYYYQMKGTDSVLVMMKEFYPSCENVRIEGEFKNNQRNGLWKSWRLDGKLWSEAEFKNGMHDGINNVYHENGKLYYTGIFVNNERTGMWKFYDENGNLVKEIDYSKQ